MAKKLVIVMANTDPRNGEELGAPIFQASVAAAMDYEVEVVCTATAGRPVVLQIGENCLGFTFHPGFKVAIAEDLIMEFDENPPDPAAALERLRGMQREIEDALVPIMTGLIQITGLMD